MKKVYITSILGPVTPGLIRALATSTREHGGEWLSSRVVKLDGRLAALMKVSVDAELEVDLKAKLEAEFSQLHFFYEDAGHETKKPINVIELILDCNDRPGLTRDVDDIFTNLGLAVENMEVNRFQVTSIGNTVFSAKFSVGLPESISSESVIELLEGLSDDVRVRFA